MSPRPAKASEEEANATWALARGHNQQDGWEEAIRRQLPQVWGERSRGARRPGSLQRLCHPRPPPGGVGDRGVVSRTAETQSLRSWEAE